MITINTINKACGYWYACGYNDHRDQLTEPYADATAFAIEWDRLNEQASRPSLQDAFKAWMAAQS